MNEVKVYRSDTHVRRWAETDLIEAIEHSDESDGNIGRLGKTALKGLPCSVYCQGFSIGGYPECQIESLSHDC